MEEFVRNVGLLHSHLTDPLSRRAANEWLTHFRSTPHSWSVAHTTVTTAQDPVLRANAAQTLAWNCKYQALELSERGERTALLQDITAALVNTPAIDRVTVQALCVAVANLVVHSPDIADPLQHLGRSFLRSKQVMPQRTRNSADIKHEDNVPFFIAVSHLGEPAMLELLTILPGECEDAYNAQHKLPDGADAALLLKQRAEGWCLQVAGHLHSLHSAMLMSQQPNSTLPTTFATMHRALLCSNDAVLKRTAAIVWCFAAWAKWGCLHYLAPDQGNYFIALAGASLFVDPEGHPDVFNAGLEAFGEAMEHAPDHAQAATMEVVRQLPPHIAGRTARHAAGVDRLSYVFATYCATNATLATTATSDGVVLREGLLLLLRLPRPGVAMFDEADSHVAPALDALSDVLEALLQPKEGVNGEAGFAGALDQSSKLNFTSQAMEAVLQLTMVDSSAFIPRPDGSGMHRAETVPNMLRASAELPMHLCAWILTAGTFAQWLLQYLQHVVWQHGMQSAAAMQTIEVSCLNGPLRKAQIVTFVDVNVRCNSNNSLVVYLAGRFVCYGCRRRSLR